MKPFSVQSLGTAWLSCALLSCVSLSCSARHDADEPGWQSMFDGEQRKAWAPTVFGGEGPSYVRDGKLVLEPGSPLTGVHWTGPFPKLDYDFECVATRVDGSDFFCGLTFPVGDAHLSFVLGGWGGSLVGLSCLDGKDAARNATKRVMSLEDERPYRVRVRVTSTLVRVTLDGEEVARIDPRAHRLELRPEVAPSKPLGIASFATTATLEELRWRPIAPE